MPNQTGVNDVVHFSSVFDDGSGTYVNSKNQYYEQRKQNIYQLKTEHFIPKAKLKIDFNGSYTKGKSNVPDFKTVAYDLSADGQISGIGPTVGDGMRRFYRYLSENILDTRISGELPIGKPSTAGVRKIKVGAAYEESSRKSETYGYLVNNGNDRSSEIYYNISDIVNTDKFIMQDGKVVYTYAPSFPDNTYNLGLSVIKSAFLLVDYSVFRTYVYQGA